ncbi:MAG: ATP-binding cassette domain-containing protein, partial [Variovorax sp.]
MSLLKVDNLGKSFGGVKAVDGISFELHAGELLALIGPNGAGKSTTFNMVNGQLKADQGSILFDELVPVEQDRALVGLELAVDHV